jgi:hypothetical protein
MGNAKCIDLLLHCARGHTERSVAGTDGTIRCR